MKSSLIVPIIVAGVVLVCLTGAEFSSGLSPEPGYVSKAGSKIEAVYHIGAFLPSKIDYNMNHYDSGKMIAFLDTMKSRYQDKQIVEVDGLKWIKTNEEWTPYPNPPIPVFVQGEDSVQHTMKYAKWIDDHPHFGYPPLPFQKRRAG